MENFAELIEALIKDERIPDTPVGKLFSDEQWDALCEYTEMTQEMFNSCLKTCNDSEDSILFWHIIKQFPELKVNYSEEIKAAHKVIYEQEREKYITKFGTDYFFD